MARRQSKLVDEYGRPFVIEERREPSSRYDAAQTSDENKQHWAQADMLSAREANNPSVRRKLVSRSRYERDNDPYYGGMIRTLGADIFGTGAKLQCQSQDDDTLNSRIEARFAEHIDAIGLTQRLLVSAEAKIGDGETVGIMRSDNLEGSETFANRYTPVPLDVQFIETEQMATPAMGIPKNFTLWVDGIELDKRGKPVAYHILREHPGDTFVFQQEFERVPPGLVLHWFRRSRHGQYRGVPECTASLPIGAQRRRWAAATLTAAEAAADFAVLITSNLPSDFTNEDLPSAWDSMELNRGMITTLPSGGDAKQMKSEHPNQEYSPFKHEQLKEMGRPVGAPYSIVGMDGSEHNYSSLRYERELYQSAVKVERESCRFFVLDPFFRAWYAMARFLPGYLADDISTLPETIPFGWYWPGFAAIDPVKEAVADTERLSNCTTTLQELLAEYGQDWRVFLNQRAREIKEMKRLGIPLPAWAQEAGKAVVQAADSQSQPSPQDQRAAVRIALMQEVG
jgi:lambda family phage portal protein